MFEAILSGGPGGEAPQESREVWGAAGLPMVGIFMNLKVLTRGGVPPSEIFIFVAIKDPGKVPTRGVPPSGLF